ncbi:MAG: hypothetical protein RLZZ408_1862 [Verrucomicrobiota bacterium]|jgi:type I restriction enzyme S subunit
MKLPVENIALPSDWEVSPVSEIAEFARGVSWGKAEEALDKEGLLVISIPNIKDGWIDYESKFNHYLSKEVPKSKRLKIGDIVFVGSSGSIQNVGRNARVSSLPHGSVAFASFTFKATPKPTVIDGEFFYFLVNSELVPFSSFSKRAADGKFNFQLRDFANRLLVPLPPLPEQKKIAEILSTVQRAIEEQERIIQTTTELKKALMQKLFTEGLRGEPQKQTEIGPVPKSWEVVELGKIAKIERGKFSHRPRNEPRFYGGEYPFVQTGDVSNCDGYVRSYTQTLNEEGLAISKMFSAGTILITIAANIGFTGILEFDSACPDSLIGITPNDNVHTEFLNYYLITKQPEMDRLAPKGTQKNINIQFLKPWPVPLPSFEEQREIAKAFSSTDRKIRLATQKRTQLQDLFRTLLHELMTAKTRV